jgi:A/G-specific adenine glycosylase
MLPRGLRGALLRWYDRNRRDLPWRRTRDPHAIWIAEIMLQQTRVDTVVPYYERFLARFPDAAALAAADEDEVLSLWSGLGYYRRARGLRACALELMERHGGRLPDDVEALAELPGIGRYTAGAIASTAFGLAAPVLDGNVRRVLARVFAVDRSRGGRAGEQGRLWQLAAELAAGVRPGDLNQALMELGALVCTPREPLCASCPAARSCLARARGAIERYPAAEPRATTRTVHVALGWIARGERLLLEREGRGPLRGRWDLPAREGASAHAAARALADGLAADHGLVLAVGARTASLSHAIMNRRLSIEVYACRVAGRTAGASLRWIEPAAIDGVPVSGATRKAMRAVATQPRSSPPSSSSSVGSRRKGHARSARSSPAQ